MTDPNIGASRTPANRPSQVDPASPLQSTNEFVITTLLIAYTFPLYCVGVATIHLMWTGGGSATSTSESNEYMILRLFAEFIRHPDSLAQFHKLLLPLIAGLSVVAFRESGHGRTLARALMIGTVFTLVAAVAIETLLNANLPNLRIAGIVLGEADKDTFFSRMEDNVLMYLMIMLGLRTTSP